VAIVKSESRRGTPISLVAIHTNEGNNKPNEADDKTAENLAGYLDRENAAGRSKSYHRICDDDSTVIYAPDSNASWALRTGNSRSLNLCLTGWSHWSRAQWLEHLPMLHRAANEVRGWCLKYNIPMCKLTPQQVGADQRGICGHGDWSVGKRPTLGKASGDHTDPGPNFPWDLFIPMVAGQTDVTGETESDDDMDLNYFSLNGAGSTAIPIPVGAMSADGREAWVSVCVAQLSPDAIAHIRIYPQGEKGGTGDPVIWGTSDLAPAPHPSNLVKRRVAYLKSPTTHVVVHWDLRASATGGWLLIETKKKG
jgi:N-acetylmuramoyl-L-alanine amidase-like protein